jgi:hypothetical protein
VYRVSCVIGCTSLAAACLGVAAHAQQASPPPFATTKVDGTEWNRCRGAA